MAGASGAVRAALCSFITGYDHLDGVQRSKAAKDDVRKFLLPFRSKHINEKSFGKFFISSDLISLVRCGSSYCQGFIYWGGAGGNLPPKKNI